MSPEQHALAEAMSGVSQTAYCAGWMSGTEYEVWRLLHEGGGWGMADAGSLAPLLAGVRAASRRAGCWIVWDEELCEQPVGLDEWRRRYEAWSADSGRHP